MQHLSPLWVHLCRRTAPRCVCMAQLESPIMGMEVHHHISGLWPRQVSESVCVISPTTLPSPPVSPQISFFPPSTSLLQLSSYVSVFRLGVFCVFFFSHHAVSNFIYDLSLSRLQTSPFPASSLPCWSTGGQRDRLIALLVRARSCLPSRARLKFTDRERFLLRPGVDS